MIDSKILTQYRESPNLNALIGNGLREIQALAPLVEGYAEKFSLDTAVGDQLTILGRRMGFLRCHCVCEIAPVFGFVECRREGDRLTIVGFCGNGSFVDCFNTGQSTLCLNDDETYRAHLKARRYQMRQLYDFDSLQAAIREIWGETAFIIRARDGVVSLSTGRTLTPQERSALSISLRVLPIAPGISIRLRTDGAKTFGFGEGWAGFCEGAVWSDCAEPINPYDC